MTVAQSIIRTTFMIKELATWLEADVQKDGFCAPNSLSEMDLQIAENTFRHLADTCRDQRKSLPPNSLSEMDLQIAENTFRHLADTCRDQRKSLLANAPGPYKHAEQ